VDNYSGAICLLGQSEDTFQNSDLQTVVLTLGLRLRILAALGGVATLAFGLSAVEGERP